MKAKSCLFACAALLLAAPMFLHAQDASGCSDSPLISRFPGSVITACDRKADDSYSFEMGSGKPKKDVEGKYYKVSYNYPKTASKAQVVRNITTALHNAGFTFLYDSGDYGDFTVQTGKTFMWVSISGGNWYDVVTVEQTALTQDVVATAAVLQTGLQATGHSVVNGIQFDTGKAEIKPESKPALEQVGKLLEQDHGLKLYIVGHTDNVGSPAANLDLSKRRAAAVVQALETEYHVAADRLSAFGCGPYAPVQSNDSEDGRAINRRVEIVKQ
jgi:outer membrane protein OmpA-like peptidoglycan-associated protein